MTDRDLPIPDFDHVPLGNLTEHLTALDREQLQVLLDHEHAHGARLPVLERIRHRIEALDGGAEPTGSMPEHLPETSAGASAPADVTPATAGPTINPPSHGVPTNPAQPR
ncbi:hypothetical protein JG551_001985 [Curtobacterium flaccumfaciens pv. flaccumfaciens]|uniref:hypothetical protein n=1 Tax=Curtobacterium flaccumfaciens TaxID=2035 RepID=UPI001BCE1886|nr:hypothetical protein [Curtobacterium flaccumfaciens]QVG64657.1 hypothetical protein JG551_001985 [Curtobacterium flaccumfaciens pv. flaccumfaciens]